MSQRLSTSEKNYIIQYTTQAWLKIFTLAKLCEHNECAAFGKITRDGDVFTVHDIYVYPQLITGTTVTSDDDKYLEWLMALPEDVSENLKFQVHSHVKMGVTPSSVDLPTYMRTVETAPKDDYVLFMIVNQNDRYSLRLYEKKDDTIYDEDDLEVVIIDNDGMPLDLWYATEEKEKIKKKEATSYLSKYNNKISPGTQASITYEDDYYDTFYGPAYSSTNKLDDKEEEYQSAIRKGNLISTDKICPDCGSRLYLRPLKNDYLCIKCTEAYTKEDLRKYESL